MRKRSLRKVILNHICVRIRMRNPSNATYAITHVLKDHHLQRIPITKHQCYAIMSLKIVQIGGSNSSGLFKPRSSFRLDEVGHMVKGKISTLFQPSTALRELGGVTLMILSDCGESRISGLYYSSAPQSNAPTKLTKTTRSGKAGDLKHVIIHIHNPQFDQ